MSGGLNENRWRPEVITHLKNNGIEIIYIVALAFWLWFSIRKIRDIGQGSRCTGLLEKIHDSGREKFLAE
jgi:hypothetical protein